MAALSLSALENDLSRLIVRHIIRQVKVALVFVAQVLGMAEKSLFFWN